MISTDVNYESSVDNVNKLTSPNTQAFYTTNGYNGNG